MIRRAGISEFVPVTNRRGSALINPLRGLAILDPRPSTVAYQCERTHTLAGRPCYSLLLLGHSILSLGRPAWGDQPCRRGDLVSQRGEEPNSRWWSSFDRNDGEKAPFQMRKPRADLEQQLEKYRHELAEAQEHLAEAPEQQTATADVLKVISGSPGELEPVFQAMLENATRICEAKFGNLYLHEGGALRVVASYNVPRAFAEAR